jgi:signal peptidase II
MKKKYLPIITILICLFDQISKMYMVSILEIGQSQEVIPDLFNLTLVMNPGAAFGMFANLPSNIRRLMLGLVTVLAMGLIILLLKREAKDDIISQIGLYMVMGGAFGNLIDRFKYDAVVDFLDFYFGKYHWPAFNVADSAICVAVFILVVRFFILPKKTET